MSKDCISIETALGTPPGESDNAYILNEGSRRLNPPPSDAERDALEAMLVPDGGVKDAFVDWADEHRLLDGHTRDEICKRLGLPIPPMRLVSLPDRAAATEWIICHQTGRRNLTSLGAAYLRGKQYPLEKAGHDGRRANQHTKELNPQNDGSTPTTAQRLAKEHKVSPRTIERDARFAEAVDRLAELGE